MPNNKGRKASEKPYFNVAGDGDSISVARTQHPESLWVDAEAKRRNVSISQVVRDAFRAYRKLVPEAAPMTAPVTNSIPVNF